MPDAVASVAGTSRPPERPASRASSPGKQELPGTLVRVDGHLDRPEQPRSQLDLVDHHEAVVLHEASRIVPGGAQGRRIVQKADQGVRVLQRGDPGQRALASLTGAVERDDSGIGEGLGHEVARLARHQVPALIYLTSMVRARSCGGQSAA